MCVCGGACDYVCVHACMCINKDCCTEDWRVMLCPLMDWCSVAKSCPTLCNRWTTACQASLSFTVCWSRWCCPATSSSVIPFSSCPQSFPASGSFPVSLLFTSGGQSIGTSTSASVLLMNIQDWFPLGLSGLISSPGSPRDSQEPSPTPQFESINSLMLSLLYGPALTSIHDYWKNHSLD